MIVISSSLVLAEVQDYSPDNPVIGYDNCALAENLSADSADVNYPVTNLANPSTALDWRSASTALQYLTLLTGRVDALDYIAVARHNFASAGIAVTPQGRDTADGEWIDLTQEVLLADDSPVLFRFEPQGLYQIRLRLKAGTSAPRAAVLYAGLLLVMERGIWVGHTALKYARRTEVVNGRAESGDFVGRVVIGEYRESLAKFMLLSPSFYREKMDPFLAQAQENPFFFAWRPQSYPRESGFAVLINDPAPLPTDPSHLLEIEFAMRGVP